MKSHTCEFGWKELLRFVGGPWLPVAVVALLTGHPAVRVVYYPGLPSHPGHAIARTQQRGFGSMLSFEIAGGTSSVRRFIEALKIFSLAESLGGTESLVSHSATMTHASMSPDARTAAGISDNLIRLSVGLENEADLLADLSQALEAAVDTAG